MLNERPAKEAPAFAVGREADTGSSDAGRLRVVHGIFRTGNEPWPAPVFFSGVKACFTILLIVATWGLSAADELPKDDEEPVLTDHGTQVLTENLIRVREQETRLKSVKTEAGGLFAEGSLDALQSLFASPTDAFLPDSTRETARGIRQQAWQRLKSAPPEAQRQWVRSVEIPAEAALRRAIENRSPAAIRNVARQFPLTESGIRAAIIALTSEFLKGGRVEVRDELEQQRRDVSGTILESYFLKMSQPLRQKVIPGEQPLPDQPLPDQSSRLVTLSVDMTAREGSLSPPWPAPRWQWNEAVWNYPGAPQPQTGTRLESMIPGSSVLLNEFSNWRPVFWGNQIVHRSPLRIVGLDRNSGEELWTIPTQTFSAEATERTERETRPNRRRSSSWRTESELAEFGGMAEFGLMSSDDEFLFFVDHFDFFPRTGEEAGFPDPAAIRNRFGLQPGDDGSGAGEGFQTATRLVAMRRSGPSGLPEVAWTIGNTAGFQYRAVETPFPDNDEAKESHTEARRSAVPDPDQKSSASGGSANRHPDAPEPGKAEPGKAEPGAEGYKGAPDEGQQNDDGVGRTTASAKSSPSLQGHQFRGPPTGVGQRLFVVSTSEEKIWLSCLAKGTGAVIWQQPLAFFNGMQEQLLDLADAGSRASVSVVSGDVVVCTLSSGLLIAVRATDGQLLWAVALREGSLPRSMRGLRLPFDDDREEEAIRSQSVILPIVSDGVVVCADALSQRVHGIETATGRRLWSVSRRAFGAGDIGGSPDHYIAGISGEQAILIGERHCRSLNLRSGEQNWVVPVNRTTGRAECRGNRCLIPQIDGRILTVDLTNGLVIPQRAAFLPADASELSGAVCSDEDMVFVTTPVSVVVFPRADSLFTIPENDRVPAVTEADKLLSLARAFLLDGQAERAVALLRTAVEEAAQSGNSTAEESLERFLGELILRDWATRLVGDNPLLSLEGTHSLVDEELTRLLPQLNLSSEQQMRAAMLTLLSRPDVVPDAEQLEELQGFAEWKKTISMTDEWSIRPDLLVYQTGAVAETQAPQITKMSGVELKRLADNVVLFPALLKSDADKRGLIDQLTASGRFAAAEAVALIWKRSSPDQASELLKHIRKRDVIAGYTESETSSKLSQAGVAESSEVTTGLNSNFAGTISMESSVYLGAPDWDLQRTERGIAVSSLPDWVQLRYFLVDGRDGLPDLLSMDMNDGSIRDSVPLPFAFHRNVVSYRALNNSDATPGLLPIAGSDDLLMVSCSVPDKARILWTRRFRPRGVEETPLEFGPLGPDYLIWHFGEEMHCSHPLTGQDLWTRKMRLAPVSKPLAGVRRIFGDERAFAVMGTDVSSVERYRTRDGRRIGTARLPISRITDAVTVGRCLLYTDDSSRLHLFDAETGGDLLADDEPIVLGRYNPVSMCHVLTDGKVVTVSSTFEVILIDTLAGEILFRTPAASLVKTNVVFGITAFERRGRLFVGLEEQRDFMIRTVESQFRPFEPRVYAGPLLCLDPKSGQIEWSMPLVSAAIPQVYGDPTDLMLIWNNSSGGDAKSFEKTGQTINVQLVNERTGEIVVKHASVSTSRPLRCVHTAARNSIELLSRDSRITLQPATSESHEEIKAE